ncbi:MAG: hypothetical protein AAFO75_02110 [Pseudomonadota bacterium]
MLHRNKHECQRASPLGSRPRALARQAQQAARAGLILSVVAILAACGGGASKTIGSPTAGLSCIDDSAKCIGQRQKTLRYYMSSPDRSWIRQRPDAAAYASGVRLFAYKRQKSKLSCAELKAGLSEANRAPSALRAGAGRLTPAQISRGKLLATEVSRDLKREIRRRCRA